MYRLGEENFMKLSPESVDGCESIAYSGDGFNISIQLIQVGERFSEVLSLSSVW